MSENKNNESVTLEEMNANHNDWWNSLTDADKEKLYNDQKEAEDHFYNQKQQSVE